MKMKKCEKLMLLVLVMNLWTVSVSAQDLQSILSGVVQAVVGDKATTASSILGTWNIVGPKCQFESEKLLTQAGGDIAAQEMEKKMLPILERIGLTEGSYTFSEDGTYICKLGRRTLNGTYTFDEKEKTVTMKGKWGMQSVAYVTVVGPDMALAFDADKLLIVLGTLSAKASSISTTAAAIHKLTETYDGMKLGFELKKEGGKSIFDKKKKK